MLVRREFLGLSAAAAAASLPVRVKAQTANSAPLRVASTAFDSYAEAIYAKAQGIFLKHDLNVDLQILSSGAAITAAVAGGAADIGITNALPLIAAVEHGIPFVYLCSGGLINYKEGELCVGSSSTIHNGKDLDGKTIATTSLVDINVVAIKAWVDQTGGDSTKIKFVELPFPEMASALERGTVDAAPIVEPALTLALKTGRIRILQPPMYSVFGPHFMVGGWFCKRPWLQGHRDTARRFVAAIYDTANWANSHPSESAAILARNSKIKPEVLATLNRAPYGTSLMPDMLQSVLDLAYKYHAVDRRFSASSIIATI